MQLYRAREVLRLIRNDMSLDEIVMHVGCDVEDYSKLDFRNWCNCPCDMKVYYPNQLDKLVVESCLSRVHPEITKGVAFNTEAEAEFYLECFLLNAKKKECCISDRTLRNTAVALSFVRVKAMRTMLYRVLTRCRRIYIEMVSKVYSLMTVT